MNLVYLKPIDENDTDYIVKWRNSDNVRQYFIYQKEFTRESHLNWYETRVKTGEVAQFMIIRTEDDKPIGSVYLRDIDHTNNKAEFGIFIGETDSTSKGFGTIATKLIMDYGFNECGLHRIYLRVYADNKRAMKAYEKAGFSYEGTLKDSIYVNGSYRDVVIMSAIREVEEGDE